MWHDGGMNYIFQHTVYLTETLFFINTSPVKFVLILFFNLNLYKL